jgi:hypothetical protein
MLLATLLRLTHRNLLPLLLLLSLGANAQAGGDLGLCSSLGPNYCAGRCGDGWTCHDALGHPVNFNCGPCCTPATCQPGECGDKPDGCGGTVNCGCCPRTSCNPGECGTVSDGCGGTIYCGCCPRTSCNPGECGTVSAAAAQSNTVRPFCGETVDDELPIVLEDCGVRR